MVIKCVNLASLIKSDMECENVTSQQVDNYHWHRPEVPVNTAEVTDQQTGQPIDAQIPNAYNWHGTNDSAVQQQYAAQAYGYAAQSADASGWFNGNSAIHQEYIMQNNVCLLPNVPTEHQQSFDAQLTEVCNNFNSLSTQQ